MRQCLTTNLIRYIGIFTIALGCVCAPNNAFAKADPPQTVDENNPALKAASQAVTDDIVKQALIEMNKTQGNAANTNTAGGVTVPSGAAPLTDAASAANAAAAAAGLTAAAPAAPVINSADLGDPDTPLFKANALAKQRKQDLYLKKNAGTLAADEIIGGLPTPPEMSELQHINDSTTVKDALSSADTGFLEGDMAKDMRKEAQRNAALSYGARGGLAKRSYEIMEKMDDYAPVLDKVFDFRSLLVKAPSGMLIEPPIIKESLEALVIKDGGNEAAVADSILDINKNAKIVSAPRDWRQYLLQTWSSKVPPPPKILWPQNAEEQANWDNWVSQGWEAGIKQAEQIFELNTNRLAADYRGMVRYRILLAQGMVSAPFTTQEDRGVVGGKDQMRIGDRAIRITEPTRFLTGANIWRPADR